MYLHESFAAIIGFTRLGKNVTHSYQSFSSSAAKSSSGRHVRSISSSSNAGASSCSSCCPKFCGNKMTVSTSCGSSRDRPRAVEILFPRRNFQRFRLRVGSNTLLGGFAAPSPNRCVNTLAKEKPATCQNQTLVTRNPTPRARRPMKDIANAVRAISHACQYAMPPCMHRRSARNGS